MCGVHVTVWVWSGPIKSNNKFISQIASWLSEGDGRRHMRAFCQSWYLITIWARSVVRRAELKVGGGPGRTGSQTHPALFDLPGLYIPGLWFTATVRLITAILQVNKGWSRGQHDLWMKQNQSENWEIAVEVYQCDLSFLFVCHVFANQT